MSSPDATAKPTDTECTILNAIWLRGSATVRQIYEDLMPTHGMGHTTVLKFMQIMTEKGLLNRDSSVRPQVFSAAQSQAQTQKKLVRDLLDRAFGGTPGNLALQALSMRKSTPEELEQIRSLLDTLERKQR
ncbi:MAG: transcriptional regulator [Phycisphaerae bacterium]|nr:transcriptional regulator [Phycisphaerae bacterium]MAB84102.1 transcriptional regulator [Phycisphaerae bacterium]|tara:strand:- start:369 stop:761 length:393 start_codon:yes stop_codon:yes gene_type:complete